MLSNCWTKLVNKWSNFRTGFACFHPRQLMWNLQGDLYVMVICIVDTWPCWSTVYLVIPHFLLVFLFVTSELLFRSSQTPGKCELQRKKAAHNSVQLGLDTWGASFISKRKKQPNGCLYCFLPLSHFLLFFGHLGWGELIFFWKGLGKYVCSMTILCQAHYECLAYLISFTPGGNY